MSTSLQRYDARFSIRRLQAVGNGAIVLGAFLGIMGACVIAVSGWTDLAAAALCASVPFSAIAGVAREAFGALQDQEDRLARLERRFADHEVR